MLSRLGVQCQQRVKIMTIECIYPLIGDFVADILICHSPKIIKADYYCQTSSDK